MLGAHPDTATSLSNLAGLLEVVTRHQVSREIATPSFARSFHVVQSSQVG